MSSELEPQAPRSIMEVTAVQENAAASDSGASDSSVVDVASVVSGVKTRHRNDVLRTTGEARNRLEQSGLMGFGGVQQAADQYFAGKDPNENGRAGIDYLEQVFKTVTKEVEISRMLAERLLGSAKIPEMVISNVGMILNKVGEGAFGIVYKVYRPDDGDIVAVKVSKTSVSDESEQSEQSNVRFVRETGIVQGLAGHPNIVGYRDSGVLQKNDQGYRFLVMEFLDGRTLQDVLKDRKLIPAGEVKAIFVQVARVLAALEKKNIIHRDIKPENIHILPDGTIKVMDFGFALSDEFADMKATRSNATGGTFNYGAPEQTTQRFHDVTPKADMYSANATMYHLLTGKVPIDAADPIKYIKAVEDNDRLPIDMNAVTDPVLRSIFERNLVKDPVARMTPAQLLAALESGAVESRGITTVPTTRGNITMRIVLVAGLIFGVLTAGGAYILSRKGDPAPGGNAVGKADPSKGSGDGKTPPDSGTKDGGKTPETVDTKNGGVKDKGPDPKPMIDVVPALPPDIVLDGASESNGPNVRLLQGTPDAMEIPNTIGFYFKNGKDKHVGSYRPLGYVIKTKLGMLVNGPGMAWEYPTTFKGEPATIFCLSDGQTYIIRASDGEIVQRYYNHMAVPKGSTVEAYMQSLPLVRDALTKKFIPYSIHSAAHDPDFNDAVDAISMEGVMLAGPPRGKMPIDFLPNSEYLKKLNDEKLGRLPPGSAERYLLPFFTSKHAMLTGLRNPKK